LKEERNGLVSWDEKYNEIDKALPILEENLDIVEQFAAKLRKKMSGPETTTEIYPLHSIVKGLVLAKIIEPKRETGVDYVCHYLKDHEEIARELGFRSLKLKNRIFFREYDKMEKKGLDRAFMLMVDEITRGRTIEVKTQEKEPSKKDNKEEKTSRFSITIIENDEKTKLKEQIKTKIEILNSKMRESAWKEFNDKGEKEFKKIAKTVSKEFNKKIDESVITQWIEEEIKRRDGRKCGDMKCFGIPDEKQDWGWCKKQGRPIEQRNKNQYICKEMIRNI